jgi:hypothetical protein
MMTMFISSPFVGVCLVSGPTWVKAVDALDCTSRPRFFLASVIAVMTALTSLPTNFLDLVQMMGFSFDCAKRSP